MWPRPVRGVHRPRRRSRRTVVRHAGVLGPPTRDDAGGPRNAGAPPSTSAGVHRRAGRPVRLLHQRHDHERRGASEAEGEAERVRDSIGARRKPLPLRNSPESPARHPAGGAGMTPMTAPGLSRRDLLKSAGAVIVTFAWPSSLGAQGTREASAGGLDAWLAVANDGAVTLFTGKVELGTGVTTA